MARKTTRELLFDQEPFSFLGGEEFTVSELFPGVVEDEDASAARFESHVSDACLAPELLEPSEIAEIRALRAQGMIPDLSDHPCCAQELSIEEVADPSTSSEPTRFLPLSFFRELKRMRRLFKSKVAQSRRIEFPDGHVVMVLRHT
ncbi:hypothetical protein HGA34_03650 [Candidatus Falkowbacteria bacterium]|nr:hypothetical protein [Candidatus Falkowbacteria bacterium]